MYSATNEPSTANLLFWYWCILIIERIGYEPPFFFMQSASKVPAWLLVNKSLIPDFVIKDPKVDSSTQSCASHLNIIWALLGLSLSPSPTLHSDCSSMGDHGCRVHQFHYPHGSRCVHSVSPGYQNTIRQGLEHCHWPGKTKGILWSPHTQDSVSICTHFFFLT